MANLISLIPLYNESIGNLYHSTSCSNIIVVSAFQTEALGAILSSIILHFAQSAVAGRACILNSSSSWLGTTISTRTDRNVSIYTIPCLRMSTSHTALVASPGSKPKEGPLGTSLKENLPLPLHLFTGVEWVLFFVSKTLTQGTRASLVLCPGA